MTKARIAALEAEVLHLREKNALMVSHLVSLMAQGGKPKKVALPNDHAELLQNFVERTLHAQVEGEELQELVARAMLDLLGGDQVSVIYHGGSGSLVAVQQICSNEECEVPVPYLISAVQADPYRVFLEEVLQLQHPLFRNWDNPVEIHPRLWMGSVYAGAYRAEDEGPGWIFCLQWKNPLAHAFSQEPMESLVQFAGALLEQDYLLGSLRELRDQNESLIQSMPSAIIGLDLLGTVTHWNGKAETLFGIEREQAQGRAFAKLVPAFASVVDHLVKVLQSEGDELILDPLPFRNRFGIVRHFQPHIFHMLTSGRGEVAVRIDDITRQLDNQKQILQAQRMETLGALAGGISQEFSESLAGILGSGTRMRRRWRERGVVAEGDNEDLDVLLHCARRASDLVHRLLLLARQPKEGMVPIDLVSCMHTVYQLCISSLPPPIQIHLETAVDSAWISGNSSQIENILLNLCLNACDAMPRGGHLHMRLQLSSKAPGGSSPGQSFWQVEVADNGFGMTPEIQARIFDPFFTTRSKSGGSGLGLVIVERALESHGAYLDLQSAPKQGTIFRMFFPCLRETVQLTSSAVNTEKLQERPLILVVEEGEVMRKVKKRILEDCGFAVHATCDGREALEYFSRNEYALVLVEMELPGMGGEEVVKLLRGMRTQQRVLYTSVRRPDGHAPLEMSEAPTGFLEKPFTFDQLESVVRSLLA